MPETWPPGYAVAVLRAGLADGGVATGGRHARKHLLGMTPIGYHGGGVVVDALVERELGVEVGVLTVAVTHMLAGKHFDEHLDKTCVQLGAGDAPKLVDRLERGDRLPVGIARRHDVVNVGNGNDAG